MAWMQAMTGMMKQGEKSEKGAKANANMMEKMKDIDPFTKMTQNLDKLVQAALPIGSAVDEALSEVTEIYNGAFMEGFAPAMDVIIETLSDPTVIAAITELGTVFGDLFVSFAPLIKDLLPAFIWLLKLLANVMILFINIVIGIINIFIIIINFIAGLWGAEDIPLLTMYEFVPMASGGSFVTKGATPILAGEAGPERVTVTPLGEGSGTGGVTVNVYAGTVITERELAETIRKTVDDVMRENTLLR